MKQWREEVLRRDGYRCKLCGYKGPHLNAHHLIFKSHCSKKYRTEPGNGLTLCDGFANNCHGKVHGRRERIPRSVLPQSVIDCLAEQGLRWIEGQPTGVLFTYFMEDYQWQVPKKT